MQDKVEVIHRFVSWHLLRGSVWQLSVRLLLKQQYQ